MAAEENETTSDLSLATTNELLEEIDKRFTAVVVIAETDRSETDRRWHRHYHGSFSRVIGMMVRAYRAVLREERNTHKEDDNERHSF